MKRALLIITFSSLLLGCLTDGPNSTGSEFLMDKKALTAGSLIRVQVKDFKVDSFRVQSSDTSFLGHTSRLVGNSGNFSMRSRIGYLVGRDKNWTPDTAGKSDSLIDAMYPDSLALSLSFLQLESDHLHAAVTSSMKKRDSVNLKVKTFIVNEPRGSSREIARDFFVDFYDIKTMKNLWRPLTRYDTVDFITVKPDPAFVTVKSSDSSKFVNQFNLPGAFSKITQFRDSLKNKTAGSDTTHRWDKQFLLMEISLADPAEENILLSAERNSTLIYGPEGDTLLPDISLYTVNNLFPIRASSYKIDHPLINDTNFISMLTGKTQGIHMYINRDELISEIEKESGGKIKIRDKNLMYNNQYFVPYAEIAVNFKDSAKINRKIPIEMLLHYEIDSTDFIQGAPSSSYEIEVPNDAKEVTKSGILVYKQNLDVVYDTLNFSFYEHKERNESGVYQFAVIYSNNTSNNDTIDVELDRPTELKHRSYSRNYGTSYINFIITAKKEMAVVTFHYNSNINVQRNRSRSIVDTDNALLKADSARARFASTFSILTLLNRTNVKNNLYHDFYIRPGHLSGQASFFELPLKTTPNGEKLLIDFEIFLYKM